MVNSTWSSVQNDNNTAKQSKPKPTIHPIQLIWKTNEQAKWFDLRWHIVFSFESGVMFQQTTQTGFGNISRCQ